MQIEFRNIWLISLIERLRPDLCKKFPIDNCGERPGFAAWLVTNGVKEYKALLSNADFLNCINRVDQTTGLSVLQRLVYEARPDVQAAYPLSKGIDAILRWFECHGNEEHNLLPLQTTSPVSCRPIIQYPFGVNLIGYVYGQLGIGEDLRMAARAMLAAGIPFTLIDFPPGKDIPQNDRSLANYVSTQGHYAINIFCMTALEHGRYYAEKGLQQIEGRYNIGYWPWELSNWPEEWLDLTQLVDEVWVSTQHTYDALKAVSDVPIFIMPMAVELGEIRDFGSGNAVRRWFDLPDKATLFCFSFDLNSSIHRKNPQACVDAFLQAFPIESFNAEQVGLVIKVHKPKRLNRAWEKLKQLSAMDGRIHIIEQTLSRPDLLALYQSCDCFLSLHRAEGFGRGIAEALQLGLHVITTGYSGNVDFCYQPFADLVSYKLVKVKKGQYPFATNQVWADVNVDHAAGLMRSYYDNRLSNSGIQNDWLQFSAEQVGRRYKDRLLSLMGFLGI